MEIFNLAVPDQGVSPEKTARIKEIAFGDGYRWIGPESVNPVMEIWPLLFSLRTKALVLQMDQFFNDNQGRGFYWTTPEGVQKKFFCKKWSPTYYHDMNASMSCTFEQLMEP